MTQESPLVTTGIQDREWSTQDCPFCGCHDATELARLGKPKEYLCPNYYMIFAIKPDVHAVGQPAEQYQRLLDEVTDYG